MNDVAENIRYFYYHSRVKWKILIGVVDVKEVSLIYYLRNRQCLLQFFFSGINLRSLTFSCNDIRFTIKDPVMISGSPKKIDPLFQKKK